MKPEFTKLLDLYKGYEGEPGYFFAAADKENNFHYYLRVWEGFVYNIFNEPHVVDGKVFGFTKLFLDYDLFDDIKHGLDNFYKFENKKEVLDDAVWYKTNRTYEGETLTFLDALIELVQYAIDNNLDLLVATDQDI